ncbi:class I mannose-6-phosphate isomerase [Mucilaginibacter sp. dw_454]|uniref:class I mannose-6-phosphate isomerase n=1 Tax=Mucilaginibacter sp. dw_454 TaxID=2720079 RepID=UPI001BD2402D|nr:class I mannose-6-phosphate isomerase [Mucilaginibacter sp. dw_454]
MNNTSANKTQLAAQLRKTTQYLMPDKLEDVNDGEVYNIYPVTKLADGTIFSGYATLAQYIAQQKTVVIDGYGGVWWGLAKNALKAEIEKKGLSVNFIETSRYLKSAAEIDGLVQPFLGTPTSVWGTKCTLQLQDLFELEQLRSQRPDTSSDINIIIGTGAALAGWDAPLIYIDVPKNEIQFRMRAGTATNLGTPQMLEPAQMYKRFYFVDWVLCNAHKKAILDKIDIVADGQWPDTINWMHKADFAAGLNQMAQSVIRVRPWFEPGAWGGQWMKNRIPGLNKDAVNYAWSFELIVPENGIIFKSGDNVLEVSFDFLMFHNNREVLGKHADKFGDEFPIRFDFLDTYDGGNLSIQCHPHLKYIQDNFGETITQDETYYILDCKPNEATVYLGFQESIDPAEFKEALIGSQKNNAELQITDYVQAHSAKKHDLFLIPNGTIHSAGANNLVLEISATPYIFTFKMYDWLRLDLDGNPRPINIDHAFNNLVFDRKGDKVQQELISNPTVIEQSEGYELIHLPTHAEHFYDVHRIDFDNKVNVSTDGLCHVMMLVEGESVLLEIDNGAKHAFAYAETFVIPAAAKSYTLINLGKNKARVIKAFLKD